VSDASRVIVVRVGAHTVVSMQNSVVGSAEDFALVVPIPVVLRAGDVKTLPAAVFDHVEQLGAPRLVEYWEQDPCGRDSRSRDRQAGENRPEPTRTNGQPGNGAQGVHIESELTAGEYQIVILSATDATTLEAWLRDHRYNPPRGAEQRLRPYLESGSKFFIARVDPAKLAFDDQGRARLSPLRFQYDAAALSLPIRVGLANSSGIQDLVVDILAPGTRYRAASYDNVTIPTNLEVVPSVRDHFGAFYNALFDAILAKHPHAVVTEFAWPVAACEACSTPQLDPAELKSLGVDVAAAHDPIVLTRLHLRYGNELPRELVLEPAAAIAGGRERQDAAGTFEHGAHPTDDTPEFQARYVIRHPWAGPIRCEQPQRARWGGAPQRDPVTLALDLSRASRGSVQLSSMLVNEVPEAGIERAGADAPRTRTAPRARGCDASNANDSTSLAIVLLGLFRPKWRRMRISGS
jgi:hypothetical protein